VGTADPFAFVKSVAAVQAVPLCTLSARKPFIEAASALGSPNDQLAVG
jgi:hypothetical protein